MCNGLINSHLLYVTYLICWVLGSCFVTFPSNLCQSDFPDTAVVYKAKDEKYNGQNKATDLK